MDGARQHEVRSNAARPFRPVVDAMSGVRGCDVATGLAHDTIEMMNDVHQQDCERVETSPDAGTIQWRSRYDGLVTIAQLGDKAVAGISGPWSGQYALTWWDRPLPIRNLELFDSLDDAQREVERWARRMRTGNYSPATSNVPSQPPPGSVPAPMSAIKPVTDARVSQPTLLTRVRALFPGLRLQPPGAALPDSIERLRQQQACADADIGDDLHFTADK
jgi:hypothetical protein